MDKARARVRRPCSCCWLVDSKNSRRLAGAEATAMPSRIEMIVIETSSSMRVNPSVPGNRLASNLNFRIRRRNKLNLQAEKPEVAINNIVAEKVQQGNTQNYERSERQAALHFFAPQSHKEKADDRA